MISTLTPRSARSLMIAMLAGGLIAAAAHATAEQPLIAGFEPGLYRVTPVDPDSRASERPQIICAADPGVLFHLRHNNAAGCQNQLVQPGTNRTVVNYSCPARGWGRSELRREIPGLYQLDTQGINGREPFAMRAEVRRIGDCLGAGQMPRRR